MKTRSWNSFLLERPVLCILEPMKGFQLTSQQQQELRAALRAARNSNQAKASVKINALLLLGTGMSLEEVSDVLFLDEDTLSGYVKRYQSGDLKSALKTAHKGSNGNLSKQQTDTLIEELDSRIYLTTLAVCSYVEDSFGIKYSVSGMTELLKRLGFTYKKPVLKPGNPDPDKQEEFLQRFLAFMQNKAEKEAVFFVDAVHPAHNSMPAYGWMKKGEKTELKTNSGRQRLNIHGAMNAETYEVIPLISESTVNSESTIQLLEYLEKLYPLATVIYVILDNAKYHYSKVVKEWEKTSRVKLVPLPSYSPELNLIERLWRVFKKKVLYNKYFEGFEEFKQACIDFFNNQDAHYDDISSIMGSGLEGVNI